MDIIITGSDGFIGRHICNFLETHGYSVFKLVEKAQVYYKNTYELDLTDKQNVLSFVREFNQTHQNIDVIIHLAAKLANTHQTENEQLNVLIDNIKISENIIHLTNILQPKKIINFSSMAVYPNTNGTFDEKSQIKMSENTDCMYGLAKFCSENIFDFMLKNKNIIISHLRISQVYGEGMRQDRIIPIMKNELKEKNTITVFGEGERISNFIHIDKLIEYLNYFILNNISGIFNCGNESLSYFELAQKVIKEYGNEKSIILKKEEGTKSKFILNNNKLSETILNFKTKELI